ncbi:MAG: hypothetical protein LBU28_09350 [Spirochaetaceae bacterium]|nr:hypothetical protein [Spirochaetaceae bacterium]
MMSNLAKKAGILLLLGGCLLFPLSAANISFLVIETGVREEDRANESSTIWENGLMDVFFDAGHIVTNAPIMRLHENPSEEFPGEAQRELDEAFLGGAEFFVLALLDYQGIVPAANSVLNPRSVSLRLFSTKPYKILYERTYPAGTSLRKNDRFSYAQNAARLIVPFLRNR